MGESLRYCFAGIIILLLSCNIYLNKEKIFSFISKDYSKDTFKLYYFKTNGRAAVIKALFSYSKVKFENIFVDSNWKELKKNTALFEFGQVPILVHNDKILSQSKAIFVYLARLFDLYGKNIDDKYQIDSLLSSYDDISKYYTPLFFPKTDDEKNNKEKYKEIYRNELKRFFGIYEERYKKLGNGKYYLGNYFSLADIYLVINMNVFSKAVGGFQFIKNNAPKLSELLERLRNQELKEFFEKYYYE